MNQGTISLHPGLEGSLPLERGCMIWLIVSVSVNGGLAEVVESIPYADMQSCQAAKAVRDSRQADFYSFANNTSVKSTAVCSDEPQDVSPSLLPPPRK
jgi:hypothetical protein